MFTAAPITQKVLQVCIINQTRLAKDVKCCISPGGKFFFSLQITSKEMCTWREIPRNDLNMCRSWGYFQVTEQATCTLVKATMVTEALTFLWALQLPASWNNLALLFSKLSQQRFDHRYCSPWNSWPFWSVPTYIKARIYPFFVCCLQNNSKSRTDFNEMLTMGKGHFVHALVSHLDPARLWRILYHCCCI